MPKPFKAGSKELDLLGYERLGDEAPDNSRRSIAEAAFLLLWGGVWEVTEQPGRISTAIDRLFAFAGDDITATVANDIRLGDWRDIDAGSVELLKFADTRIKQSFKKVATPNGFEYWTAVTRVSKRCVRVAGIDAPAHDIIPVDIVDELARRNS
jgi:hypothetical protein